MLSTFIKLPFVIKICVLFIFEWPFYTGFTVLAVDLLTLCILMNSSIWFDTMSMGWFIVNIKGSQG